MPQILHKNARLTVYQRKMIRESDKPIRVLARELGVSPVTVWKWKHRESPYDAPYGPREAKTSWEGWQVEAIRYLRERLRLPRKSAFGKIIFDVSLHNLINFREVKISTILPPYIIVD